MTSAHRVVLTDRQLWRLARSVCRDHTRAICALMLSRSLA